MGVFSTDWRGPYFRRPHEFLIYLLFAARSLPQSSEENCLEVNASVSLGHSSDFPSPLSFLVHHPPFFCRKIRRIFWKKRANNGRHSTLLSKIPPQIVGLDTKRFSRTGFVLQMTFFTFICLNVLSVH